MTVFVLTDTDRDFNPRSPCGERLPESVNNLFITTFQSTLPVWGATTMPTLSSGWISISIHAPRVGSDGCRMAGTAVKCNFNPRSPCGERLMYDIDVGAGLDFNPRSPCGERQQRYTNFKVHLWQQGRIFASLREERRNSHQAAALRDRFFDGNLGANLPAFSVYYGFAVRESRCPPAYSCSCSQNAPPSFRTGYPGSKTAASPFLRP